VRVARRTASPDNVNFEVSDTVLCAAVIVMLLVIGGVEMNPGPNTTTDEKLDAIIAKVEKLDSMEENVLMIKNQMSSMESKVNSLETKILDMEATIDSLSTVNTELMQKVKVMARKEDYLENQSRRNNLVFRGLREKEGGNESWRDCEDLILDVTRNVLGVPIQASDIERAHRVAGGKYPRAIVVKFLSFKKREEVFRNKNQLKGKVISINEDFSHRVLEDRRVLIAEMMSARADGYDAVVTFDKLKVNGKVYQVDENSRQVIPAYYAKIDQQREHLQQKQPQQLQQQHHQEMQQLDQRTQHQQSQHQQLQYQQPQNQLPQNQQPQQPHQPQQRLLLQQPLLQRQHQVQQQLQQQQQQLAFEQVRRTEPPRQNRRHQSPHRPENTENQLRKSQRIRGAGPPDRMEPSTDVSQV
jgi:septal ring factor EnvC (AmiA/AmiB activator)